MLAPETIKRLKENNDFIAFTDFVFEQIGSLNSVSGLDKLPNAEAGEEAKARLKALAKLQEILTPFIKFRERKEPSIDEIQKRKDRYAL